MQQMIATGKSILYPTKFHKVLQKTSNNEITVQNNYSKE